MGTFKISKFIRNSLSVGALLILRE